MSDQMMLNILRMPIDDRGDVHMSQFIATAQDAADMIEELLMERDALAAYVDRLCQQSESATFKPSLKVAKMETRHTRIRVAPTGDHIHSDQGFTVEIDSDCSGGEFVVVTDHADEHSVGINPEEWPSLRDAIDKMVDECREGGA